MQTVELNAKILGNQSNPPVIILHGLFGSSRNWSHLADQLAQQYRVYNLDLRNHGDSPHLPAMDYQNLAADVITFMDAHNIQSSTILGHSMGGKVAMWIALSAPDRIQHLVVVDIAPVQYSDSFKQIFTGLKTIPLNNLSSRQQADQYLAEYVDEMPIRQFLLQNLINQGGKYQWRIPINAIEQSIHLIIGFPVISHLKPYLSPVLFVAGAQSSYLAPEHHHLLKEFFPIYTLEVIENAGHWVHAEQPKRLLDTINHFTSMTKPDQQV